MFSWWRLIHAIINPAVLSKKHNMPIIPMPAPALPPFLPEIIHAAANETKEIPASTVEATPYTGCLLSVKQSSPLSFLCPFFLNLILHAVFTSLPRFKIFLENYCFFLSVNICIMPMHMQNII